MTYGTKIRITQSKEWKDFADQHLDVILNTISPETREQLIKCVDKDSPAEGDKYIKYMRDYMYEKLMFYKLLDIPDNVQVHCLDIGTGSGYFPYILKYFNHSYVAIDVDTSSTFNDTIKLLDIDRINYEVESDKPLPNFEKKFDYIIGTRICFNNHNKDNIWYEDDWKQFVKHLIDVHLKDDGAIYFHFNKDKKYNSLNCEFILSHLTKTPFRNNIAKFTKDDC